MPAYFPDWLPAAHGFRVRPNRGKFLWHTPVTIFEGLRQGKLIINEPDAPDSPIPKPEKGQIALYGVLNYGGYYDNDRGKPATPSEFGGPMAWNNEEGLGCFFSAVLNEQTGEIVKARLYYMAENSSSLDFEGNLTDKLNGSFGKIDKNNFVVSVSGPQWEHSIQRNFPKSDKPDGTENAVVMGTGDILAAANGATFPVKLYIGVASIPKKYPVRKPGNNIITFGNGTIKVIR